MKITEHVRGDVAELVLSGSLLEDADYPHGTVGESVERLAREGAALVLLDLTDLDRIDAMGLGEIAGAYRRAVTHGAELKLRNPRPHVDRLLSVTKLRTVIDVWGEGDQAPPARPPGTLSLFAVV